jgi:hypothetical protein
MDDRNARLTDAELRTLFDQLFPRGFAGADVLVELAPDGWEQSPLLACFHPSVERVLEERIMMHRNFEEVRQLRFAKHGPSDEERVPSPEPTLEEVRREYTPEPMQVDEELTELIGCALWDIFSDNHDVITQDGRIAEIGSFRGASAFLDEYVCGNRDSWREGDCMRFYMGTIWLNGRADLAPVYALIFRRLKSLGASWKYAFPQIYLTELASDEVVHKPSTKYSVSQGAVAELEAQKKRAEVARFRAELDEANARAREEALDQEPPATVRAYRDVYGRDPHGWPPM